MYLSLIDAVSTIVKTYGVDILSGPKFWHILSDSYPFGNKYALKETFKSCLTTGYISKLVAIKGNSKKTKAEIAHIIDSESKINPGKEGEYSAVLYSVAIAIGSCNKKEYSDFINRNNPNPSPSPKPKTKPNTPKPAPNNNQTLSRKERFGIFWFVFSESLYPLAEQYFIRHFIVDGGFSLLFFLWGRASCLCCNSFSLLR